MSKNDLNNGDVMILKTQYWQLFFFSPSVGKAVVSLTPALYMASKHFKYWCSVRGNFYSDSVLNF